jgi:hypothetical protein
VNHLQDDAITATAQDALSATNVPVTTQDATTGTFDSVTMIDAAGAEHLVEARYAVTNNNVVHVYWRRRTGDGAVTEQRYQLGSTASITDPNYWKIDSVRAWPRGNDLLLRIAGHQIQDSSPFRRMGQGQATVVIVGVWAAYVAGGDPTITLPEPSGQRFSDVAPGNPFYAEIEIAAELGLISGYADGTFRWGASLTRGQAAKIAVGVLRAMVRLLNGR